MLFSNSAFIGVDCASGNSSYTLAALDEGLNLLAVSEGELDDVTAFAAGYESALLAINAPLSLNRGLVRAKMQKQMLTPHQVRGAEMRMAEYDLRERGIPVSGTPSTKALCAPWMQAGMALRRKLENMGFDAYPASEKSHQFLETHPHACYCVLAGAVPQTKPSIEGRLQRQLLLHESGVRIKDPMDFFEEITRFKMMKGIWPVEILYTPEQLDALAAAYVAWLAANKPDSLAYTGDEREGLIFLPGALKEKYEANGKITS